jgi:hypothetical protein
MSISVHSTTTQTGVGVTTVTLTPTAAVGELMVMVCAVTGNVAITPPAGWSQTSPANNLQHNGTGLSIGVFVRRFKTGDTSFAPTSNVAGNWAAGIIVYAGASGTAGVDSGSNTTTVSQATQNAPSQTDDNVCALWVLGIWGVASAAVFSAQPAGFTIEMQTKGTGIAFALADKPFPLPIPNPGTTGTLSITVDVAGLGVGFSGLIYPGEIAATVVDPSC